MKAAIKPDRALVKMAERAGVELHKDERRKKGETMLQWRVRCWGIPPWTNQPIDNQVLVWRLPPLQLSPGGLIIPEDHQSPNVKGVLLAMGPRAMDTLVSNGIEPGHIVLFARFAGWEPHDNTPEYMRHNQVLVLKDKDINGSDDLKAALDAGKMTYVKGPDGRYSLADVKKPVKKMLPASARKRKLLALAEKSTSPYEADTARRLAKKER